VTAVLAVIAAAAAGAVGIASAHVARADGPAAGGEIVIIDSVTVGNWLTTSPCLPNVPSIPVTIVATFITGPGGQPVGPYAVANWSGGFGGYDNHYGARQGHSPIQVFHILLTAGQYIYHGAGTYSASVIVQDVGLAGGYAERDNIPVNVQNLAPFHARLDEKCPLAFQTSRADDPLKTLVMAYAKDLLNQVCGACPDLVKIAKGDIAYGEILELELLNAALNDPPDNDYQQIAGPAPPPVLPPPAGTSPSQQAAITALETDFASAIGDARAMEAAGNRAWGAGNAGNAYWYRAQMLALAKFAAKTSSDLRRLPAACAAVQASFAGQIPAFAVTAGDVSTMLATLVNGLPGGLASTMTRLGESPADQQQIAQGLLSADASQVTAANGGPELFAPPQDYADLASVLNGLAAWAGQAISQRPPVVTGLSAGAAPVSGGTTLTVYGSNMQSVTGISFGPSTPASGLGANLFCEPNQCEVTVPPGTGTVDVTADGPGGPSPRTPADQFKYQTPSAPSVTRIFPATGSVAGGTSVEIFGSGLQDSTVYFGPTIAQNWTCTDVLCTAAAPPSASLDTVDIRVSNPAGSSALSAADRFSYQPSPPPPPPPTVTGVSPASGGSNGGDQVTITGSGFTGTTAVDFGGIAAASFAVVDDSHIMATTPIGRGTIDVTVYNAAGASPVTSADNFNFVVTAPVVTGVAPRTGPTTGGTTITVTGENLNNGLVLFGAGGADLNATCTPTRCRATTPPAAAGVVHVEVSTLSGQSAPVAADQFTYVTAPRPTITGIEPDRGTTAGGTDVVIFGTNLAGASVKIGGQTAPDNSSNGCSNAACSVTSPPGTAGKAPVVVTRADGSSSAPGTFTYVRPGAPSITAIEPNSGLLDGIEEVDVIGQNLVGGQVYFGTVEDLYEPSACSQTECLVRPPSGAKPGTVDVSVRTVAGATAPTPADGYTYLLPTITKVSPSSGWTIGGTPVTITGTSLSGGSVSFGNSAAPGFACTDTTCTGTAPAVSSPGQVDVRVTVSNGTGFGESPLTAADHFTYRALPVPAVTAVSPSSGTDQGGDQIVVTGTYLDGGTVRLGSSTARTTSCTDTQCTAITPYSSTDGPVDVTVTTSAGTSPANTSARFTYRPPGVPAVAGVSPASGTAAGGTPVAVTGTNLTNGQVEFAGTPASNSSCQQTSCSAVSPAGTAGTVDVQVATIGGTSPISLADRFTYQIPPAPTVTGVSPADGPSSGGSFVTITGTDLTGGTVQFGSTAATDSVCTPRSCTATEPPGTAGTVDITVRTVGGTSAASPADRFVISPISVSQDAIPGLGPGDQAGGGHVYAAPDGTTWFTMPNLDKIGKIAANGTMTVYATPDTSSKPLGITQTPDRTTWYAESNPDKIISLGTGGQQTSYQVPGQPGDLRDITVGPDGRLWFALGKSGSIGAMTTGGLISLYRVPNAYGFPNDLVVGPDGRVWFTEGLGDAAGAITMGGHVTEYPVAGGGVAPWGIAVGPDGRLWFADRTAHELDAMTTTGVVTRYPLPASDGSPVGVSAGPDARLWFTQAGFDQISALAPATGAVDDYPLPGGYSGAGPWYLAMSKDGSQWASEIGGNAMIHVTNVATGIAPAVTFISPRSGPATGGTTVTITGANLSGATTVKFGTADATAVTIVDAAHVRATSPAGTGHVDVAVATPHGTTAASPADRFYYGSAPAPPPEVTAVSPATGSTAGGTPVTVTGANLNRGTIKFGNTPAATATCTATTCKATTPAGPGGTVDVRITTVGGVSPASPADQFTYLAPPPPAPTVTAISPTSGPAAGGNTITVTGTHLSGGVVTLGLNVALATCTATTCKAKVPPGAGVVDVQVTTAGGTSPVTAKDRYTYRPGTASPPDQPTATAGDNTATARWKPSRSRGSPITGYTLIPFGNVVNKRRSSSARHLPRR
jgi:large repetitive protein